MNVVASLIIQNKKIINYFKICCVLNVQTVFNILFCIDTGRCSLAPHKRIVVLIPTHKNTVKLGQEILQIPHWIFSTDLPYS